MRLALLVGLLTALAAAISGGAAAHVSPASGPLYTLPGLYSVAAQATTTATLAISPTAANATQEVTATATVAYTPAPLPSSSTGGGSLRVNPVNWPFLTSAPAADGVQIGPLGWLYVVIMLAALAASVYFYFFKRVEWKRTNSVLRRAANRFALPAMWISGLGLLFAIFRATRVDLLNLHMWFYIWMLGLLGIVGWIAYWYTQSYPAEIAKFQKTQRARQYMPTAKKSGSKQAAPVKGSGSARATGSTTPANGGTPKAGATSPAGSTPTSGQTAPAAQTRRVSDANAKRRKRK